MLSRARVLATVTLLIGCFAAAPWAQAQNLEAGKSASQLFAGTCNACHKSPRGLLKTVSPGSLTGFLREHYTTSGDMASQLSSYLISNGATDSRQAKQGADAKQGTGSDQQGRRQHGAPSQQAAKPAADAPAADAPAHETGPTGRKRLARPGEAPEERRPTPSGPAQAERGPDGRKLTTKQRLSRHSRPEESPAASEPPKAEPGRGVNDQAKGDSAAAEVDAKPEQTKAVDDVKPVEAKSEPKSEPTSEPAQAEPPKDIGTGERPVVQRDPVPAVTPAPSAGSAPPPAVASEGSSEPPASKPATPAPSAPAPTASAGTDVPASPGAPAAVTPPPASAVPASAPSPAPAGPPVPPISR